MENSQTNILALAAKKNLQNLIMKRIGDSYAKELAEISHKEA